MPRCYRFDGSAGMDLRPASVLETEDARRTELRRRREPMAVTTRIRMVDQPPCGLLSLSLFDHVPLADHMALHPRSMETVAPDLAGLYVDYMTRIAMGGAQKDRVPHSPVGRPSGRSGRVCGIVAVQNGGFRFSLGSCCVPAA